ncbi:MAG: HKD family nuclease [Oleiphilaceae bacterium]|jgi:HKD family nuclease
MASICRELKFRNRHKVDLNMDTGIENICIIDNIGKSESKIYELDVLASWSNHKDLLLTLLAACDECLLVSPFLTKDFSRLFSDVSLANKKIELISTCSARGDDQFSKPFSLRSFGEEIKKTTGKWPLIGLDQKLHSKIYIFRKNDVPFAGIVTSANLTESGLRINHETGVLIQSVETLTSLEIASRAGLDYVNLSDWQIDKLCQTAEIASSKQPPSGNREIGITSMLNNYATPSAGNRNTELRNGAEYYIKVSGVSDHPILPVNREPRDEAHGRLTFAKSPKSISLGDCLLEVAVGGACFLSYYACASAVWEFNDEEKQGNEDHQRWPYYVYANNLSLNYGSKWFEEPLMYDSIVSDFKKIHPSISVTAAGKDHFKGAIQLGHSYIQVTNEFGEYVRTIIDGK